MDPTIFLAGAPHKRSGQGRLATEGSTAGDPNYPETHKFMTKNSVLLPGHPAPNYGANLQRSCDSISPYGKPPLICGRPFKEAVAAPSLLTGLGLDSSKRLLCTRQSQRGRGGPPSSKQLPPLETRMDATRPTDVIFDDTFFVTGGGTGADHTELAPGTRAGDSNKLLHLTTTAASPSSSSSSSSSLSNGRPRSTPIALPSDKRTLPSIGNDQHSAGTMASGAALLFGPVRRDVWTADAGCLGPRRLCFRSQPIHDLVSSTLLSIDPSGVFSMYEEWSNIKNRVLSRGLDEQRSDLALYEELRQEDDDSWTSEDDVDSSDTAEDVFPERPSPPDETDSTGAGGGGGGDQDNQEIGGNQEREQDRGPGNSVAKAENQEHSEDGVEENLAPGALNTGEKPSGEDEPPPLVAGGLPRASAYAALQEGPGEADAVVRSDSQYDAPPATNDGDLGTPARTRRRRRKEPRPSNREERAANLDYARNLDKEPGLPPLRLLRESREGALRLGHMALGDPHIMALLASLDHLPSLTSIDVSDNRIGRTAIQKVVLTAEEKGVASLDLSSNHVDRASTDMLCAVLARPGSLTSLSVKNAGVSDLAGAAIMAAIGKNTVLKTLDLSGNDIGGTSDLLAGHHQEQGSIAFPADGDGEASGVRAGTAGRRTGGVAVATCLESNYWLTHLDLSWNKIGESTAATLGASIEFNQGLRWLSLAGNRVGDKGAFSLGTALAENSVLTHLDVSCNGISCDGAAALAHGLRENSTIKNIQVNGNLLGWAGGRALFRTVNFSEIPRIIGIRDCDEFAEGDLAAFDPRFPGGPFDLDLSNTSQRAIAQDVLLAASYRTGCSLNEVAHVDSSESTSATGRGGDGSVTKIQLERPSPGASALQPRGTTTGVEGSDHPVLDQVAFGSRTWSDLRTILEGLLVRSPGDSEPWPLPSKGRISGVVDFQPLPPCMANMCNASGLSGIVRAMSACAETRVVAFRLFVADLFFTTNQIQWLIGQLAESPNPLNSAELLEMMAAVAPQVYNTDGLPELIETNLSPMGCRMLVAQLGEAYPAFTGGVSGSFILDLRFPAHRLAAVRLAEAENVQERERNRFLEQDRERQQQQHDRGDEEDQGEGGTDSKGDEGGSVDRREQLQTSNLLGLWCGFRNVRYRPTRAATSNGVLGDDGERQEEAADAAGGEGDAGGVSGHGEEDEAAPGAPATGVGAAKTGLGEPMATFFQRGLSDRPTGALQLDFVCTLRPPEGTQPISDLSLARLLNSCGMLDPNFWYEYLRPTSCPVSFVDLIRLLRVKGRGDKRQAKLLVLLLRVKNSMFRAARAEKKRKEILGTSMRRYRMGGALAAFHKSTPGSAPSMASAVAKLHATTSKGAMTSGDSNTTPQPPAWGASQHTVLSKKATAAPAEGSAVGSDGDCRPGDVGSSQSTDTNTAASSAGDATNAAGAGALPGASEAGGATNTAASSAPNRKPNALGSRGRFSKMSRIVKSFPRNGNGREESRQAGVAVRAGADAAANANSHDREHEAAGAEQPQELTPTQAAVLAADSKLEGLLDAGGILRAKSGWECHHGFPQRPPVWSSAEGRVGSGCRTTSCGRSGGDSFGRDGDVCVSSDGNDRDDGLGNHVADEDVGKAVMGWASRFCEPEAGFPAPDSEEGFRLGRALARHVVRDGDAGLIGTRPPTLLVHGLCIRVRHRETGRVLKVKRSSTTSLKEEWAAVSRQGVSGSHLRIGTKKEVTVALAATFASRTQQRDWARTITPRTLGTLNMTEDEQWKEAFIPKELLASNALGGPLSLRLLVTFVEVSAQFLPEDCLAGSEFTAMDHQHGEALYEWVPSDQGPEVVNTSPEPNLSRSLAQLRSRLGSCWLSCAQAATVASLVPRVIGGKHYAVDAVVFLFSRVVDLHNFRQVVDILHEKKRGLLLHRLGDLDAFHPATTLASTPTSPGEREAAPHRVESSSRED